MPAPSHAPPVHSLPGQAPPAPSLPAGPPVVPPPAPNRTTAAGTLPPPAAAFGAVVPVSVGLAGGDQAVAASPPATPPVVSPAAPSSVLSGQPIAAAAVASSAVPPRADAASVGAAVADAGGRAAAAGAGASWVAMRFGAAWNRTVESLARLSSIHWAMIAGAVAVLGVALGLVFLRSAGNAQIAPAPSHASATDANAGADPSAGLTTSSDNSTAGPKNSGPDLRYVPPGAVVVASFRPGIGLEEWIARPPANLWADPWREVCEAAVKGLGLKWDSIARMTFASTAAAAGSWPSHSVLLIELAEGQNAAALELAGRPSSLRVGSVTCREAVSAAWPHPMAVIGPRLLVTGGAEAMALLSAGGSESAAWAPWFRGGGAGEALLAFLDLDAHRQAGRPTPQRLFDLWSDGKQPWHTLWDAPLEFCLAVEGASRATMALRYATESEAERATAAAIELQRAIEPAAARLLASIDQRVKDGGLNSDAAQAYTSLVEQARRTAAEAKIERRETQLCVAAPLNAPPGALAAALDAAAEAMTDDHHAAAQQADQLVLSKLSAALAAYEKAEKTAVAGALGGTLLPPETRLSWLAGILPQMGHADWRGRLEPGLAWNSPHNKPIAARELPEVVNPLLGPGVTTAGFPVTHYVGLAGVGDDAAMLPKDSPRAGVFGYNRSTRIEDIRDGASNTIALMGVRDDLGPWAAGGRGTVRALTRRPYVNGPDGFGSGLPHGMSVAMADGSVRFLSADVDPQIVEQLATINGGEPVSAEVWQPRPTKAPPRPDRPVDHPVDQPAEHAPPKPADPVIELEPNVVPRLPAAVSRLTRAEVDQRLALRLERLEWEQISLLRAVELLSQMSAAPISLDPAALEARSLSPFEPIRLAVAKKTLGEAIDAAAEQCRLSAVRGDHGVWITLPDDQRRTLRDWEHSVADLAGAIDLPKLIERFVVPESWDKQGGRGTLRFDAGTLRARQTADVWRQTIVFVERLRAARGRPLKTDIDPQSLALRTRRQRAAEALQRPVTANFRETPLAEVVAYLEDATQTALLLDGPALAEAGRGLADPASLAVVKAPLADALDALLRPLGLTVAPLDTDTLQISTPRALAARLQLEFYRINRPLNRADELGPLLGRIKREAAPTTWSEMGGTAAIYFDQPSGCFIVLQSPAAHATIERILAE